MLSVVRSLMLLALIRIKQWVVGGLVVCLLVRVLFYCVDLSFGWLCV